jgi:hypothetical protein
LPRAASPGAAAAAAAAASVVRATAPGLVATRRARGGPRKDAARRRSPRAHDVRRADRRVRTVVRRFSGCLGALGDRTEQVLRMRAGFGPSEALTRGQVARRLDLPAQRVSRVERRGVRRLRALGLAGACGDGAAAPATGADEGAITTAGGGEATPAASLAEVTVASDSTGDATETQEKVGVATGSVSGIAGTDRSARAAGPPAIVEIGPGTSLAALLLGALGLALLALAVRRERGRRA